MDSLNNSEKLRSKLTRGHVCIGICISLADPQISEIVGDIGYDFTWIDMEHGSLTMESGLAHVMAVRGTDCAPLVRVPSHDPVLIKPILELAPAGIIVPRIQTAQDVRTAVSACKYPPKGMRGYGPIRAVTHKLMDQRAFLEKVDEELMIFVQIEDIEAVNNIDEILAVEGLDGIALGPQDLSATMGRLGDTEAPEVVEAIDLVIEKARRRGKFVGAATGYGSERFAKWLEKGLNWVSFNTDFINLFMESKRILDDARRVAAGPSQ